VYAAVALLNQDHFVPAAVPALFGRRMMSPCQFVDRDRSLVGSALKFLVRKALEGLNGQLLRRLLVAHSRGSRAGIMPPIDGPAEVPDKA
jgi:hypothetical protein